MIDPTLWLVASAPCPFYIRKDVNNPRTASAPYSTTEAAQIQLDEKSTCPSLSALLSLSWAVLVAHYAGSTVVRLETTLTKTQTEGPATPAGQTRAVKVEVAPRTTVKDALDIIATATGSVHSLPPTPVPHAHCESSPLEKRVPIAPIVSIVMPGSTVVGDSWGQFNKRKAAPCPPPASDVLFRLCVYYSDAPSRLLCQADYNRNLYSDTQATRTLHQFVHLVKQLNTMTGSCTIQELNVVNDQDRATIASWNAQEIPPVLACLHHVVTAHAQRSPAAPAVDAWDGKLTYGELDELSSQLAYRLLANGMEKGSQIPLLFEKSKWMVVATLAVLKAGGICAGLCASHPQKSIEVILQQIHPQFILTSETQVPRLHGMQYAPVVIPADLTAASLAVQRAVTVVSDPKDVAFIIFTSGTTGKPKGILLDHRAIAISVQFHGEVACVQPASRILQFSSYAFDMSIVETWHALTRGGCLCIPSESQRVNGLPAFVREHRPSWAFFTPTMLRSYHPGDFSSLESIALGGENVPLDLVLEWEGHCRLFNLWGPAETGAAAGCEIKAQDWIPGTFGKAAGCVAWITRPEDTNRLAAVGTIGEIIIEGLVVAQGYLDDPVRTQEVFIPAPKWRSQFALPVQGRFFKTGDLAQYNADGSIRYISRQGTVVKINGQRVDIDAVEFAVHKLEPGLNIAVDAVVLPGGWSGPMLIAFIVNPVAGAKVTFSMGGIDVLEAIHDQAACASQASRLQRLLGVNLPRFMVPSLFIPLSEFPLTTTGKVDKKRLRALIQQRSHSDLMYWLGNMSMGTRENVPKTSQEMLLSAAIAQVLELIEDQIDMGANFLQLGGDSLSAIKLVRMMGEKNLSLRVDILLEGSRSLADVAAVMGSEHLEESFIMKPFTLLPNQNDAQQPLLQQAIEQCRIQEADIEDIYPCTALQEGLMTVTTSSSSPSSSSSSSTSSIALGAYIDRFVFKLPSTSDFILAQKAWNAVVDTTSILRTRIIQSPNGRAFQVVVRHSISWQHCTSVESLTDQDQGPSVVMGFGTPLAHFSAIPAIKDKPATLVMTLHHALYDGWTLSLLVQRAEQAYRGIKLHSSPFSGFIQHLQRHDQETVNSFWQQEMAGLSVTTFPELPAPDYSPRASCSVKCTFARSSRRGFSASSPTGSLRLAWALLLSLYTDSEDVVFGTVVDGRMAALPGIATLSGPTIATVPVRVVLSRKVTIKEALVRMQQQIMAMVPYEHTGLQHIARMGPEAAMASHFQTVLIVQSEDGIIQSPTFGPLDIQVGGLNDFPGYGLIVLCIPTPDSWQLEMLVDELLVSQPQAQRMLEQFGHLIGQLDHDHNADLSISQLDLLCSSDTSQLALWKRNLFPACVEDTVHKLFRAQYLINPHKTAIEAWDGSFTYGEIEKHSSTLATHLRRLGVKRHAIMPLLFERSKWITIAMLAVMKVGSAFVLLDIDQSRERNRKICEAVGARILLTSETGSAHCGGLGDTIHRVLVGKQVIDAISTRPTTKSRCQSTRCSPTRPQDLLYVVFTSGSTGEPKGVLIEHRSYCSAIIAQRKQLHIGPDTRALQLSSYAFDSFAVEILTVLCSGGCVCIPSNDESRSDIARAIGRYQATWMCITPSLLRLLRPDDVLSLRTVVAVGESMLPSQMALWSGQVQLICGYGPSECCTGASVQMVNIGNGRADVRNIGSGMGATLWVVDKENHETLMPLGAIGELVIQGPIVGRGYLNNPAKTSAAFLDNTSWAIRFFPECRDRLYKTGDLVRYNIEDGTCTFLGRKNQQTKLRGQRLDMAEVEHHLRQAFDDTGSNVMAGVIKSKGADAHPLLIAMIQHTPAYESNSNQSSTTALFQPRTLEFTHLAMLAQEKIRRSLPAVMVPSLYLQVSQMPLLPSGKANRRAVQDAASSLSTGELFSLGHVESNEEIESLNASEQTAVLLSQWLAGILQGKISNADKDGQDEITGRNVTLSRIGLDSIDMMSFSQSVSRKFQFNIPITTLFQSTVTVRHVADLIDQRLVIKDYSVSISGIAKSPAGWWREYLKLRTEVDMLPIRPSSLCVHAQRLRSARKVFLTGGTGFLGTQIIKQLVQDTSVHSITVLVRGGCSARAMARIIRSARLAQWWREEYRRVIHTWPGDLSQPRLGLSDSHWETLCGRGAGCADTFDTIIHNGAKVHWAYDYHTLEATNVQSTLQLLTALSQCPSHVGLTYISTLFPDGANVTEEEAEQISLVDGYSQTKYVSELLIQRFKSQGVQDSQASRQNPMAIVRPGAMIGSVQDGIANMDDFLWRAVSGAIAVGAYNAKEGNSWLYVSAVDWIASLVVQQALHLVSTVTLGAAATDKLVSVTTIQDGLSIDEFWQAISLATAQELEPVDGNQWLALIQAQMQRVGQSHPLWPVIDFLESMNACLGYPQQKTSYEQPPSLTNMIRLAVIRNAQYLASLSSWTPPGTDFEPVSVVETSVFRRTH